LIRFQVRLFWSHLPGHLHDLLLRESPLCFFRAVQGLCWLICPLFSIAWARFGPSRGTEYGFGIVFIPLCEYRGAGLCFHSAWVPTWLAEARYVVGRR
jgi:hypothetical protein